MCAKNLCIARNATTQGFGVEDNPSSRIIWEGEHWFHTEEQMTFLDDWITNATRTPLKDIMAGEL